jgi:integrase
LKAGNRKVKLAEAGRPRCDATGPLTGREGNYATTADATSWPAGQRGSAQHPQRCPSTSRRYLAAWSSFASFLLEQEVIEANPVRSVKAPRENAPREVWLPLDDVLRLVDAQPEPFRALAALREGAGVEISAALRVRRRDVDLRRGIVQVTGTKNQWRSRPVRVEEWAMHRVELYVNAGGFMPDALLFAGISQRRTWGVQKAALRVLNLELGYRLHDARHSYAVRQMKAGEDPQIIANNLGHKDTVMLWRVYGKYRPTAHDLARERMRAVK